VHVSSTVRSVLSTTLVFVKSAALPSVVR